MYRIRFHGRGGQGIKTASRILGSALFYAGFDVQDAPRYGAERRGAPVFAYVRADRSPIHERGIIIHPDLVLVADETLVGVAAAGVTEGLDAHSVLLIVGETDAEEWRDRLRTDARIVTLPPETSAPGGFSYVAATCTGAAARLVGGIDIETLKRAIETELEPLGQDVVDENEAFALAAFSHVSDLEGIVSERRGSLAPPPEWVTLNVEDTERSAPAIHASANSVKIRTGLWRTMRPVHHPDLCNKCVWICGSFCPDSVIAVGKDGFPEVDYEHCKGCLICVAQCPHHAFEALPEADFAGKEEKNQ